MEAGKPTWSQETLDRDAEIGLGTAEEVSARKLQAGKLLAERLVTPGSREQSRSERLGSLLLELPEVDERQHERQHEARSDTGAVRSAVEPISNVLNTVIQGMPKQSNGLTASSPDDDQKVTQVTENSAARFDITIYRLSIVVGFASGIVILGIFLLISMMR